MAGLVIFLLRGARAQAAFVAVAGIVAAAATAATLALTKAAFSGVSGAVSIGGYALLALVAVGAGLAMRVTLHRIATSMLMDLRTRLCRRIIALPLRQFEELGPAKMHAALTEDVEKLAEVAWQFPIFIVNAATVLAASCYLALSSWRAFLLTAAWVLGGCWLIQLMLKRVSRVERESRLRVDELYQHFRGLTDGAKELRTNQARRGAFFADGIVRAAASLRETRNTANVLSAGIQSWARLVSFALIGLIIAMAGRVEWFSTGVAAAYVLGVLYAIAPIEGIFQFFPASSRAVVALSNIETMGIRLAGDNLEATTGPASRSEARELRLVGVTHAYGSEKDQSRTFQLGPIDFTVRAGQVVFVIGGNGSGKSTLAKLLTGLYVPASGRIYLDGTEIDDRNREWYRQHFSTVFSDYYLFDRLWGVPAEDVDRRATEYLESVRLADIVSSRGGKLSTTALSQGQRKRLALVVALLENRPICVFDEWAADQDPSFKKIFYSRILPDLRNQGKAVVVITHDDRYFHLADAVIKLEDGVVVAREEPPVVRSSTSSAPRTHEQ